MKERKPGRRNGSAKRKRGGITGVSKKWFNMPNGKPVDLPPGPVIRMGGSVAVLPRIPKP